MAEQPRTMFAQKALDFAQLFALSLGETPVVSGKTSYKIQMSAPEGPSTGGGVQGVQHITLKPQAGGDSVVLGSANRSTNTAQLRTFALLSDIHARRSQGGDFGLDAEIYKDVFLRLSDFLKNQGMTVTEEDVAPGAAAPQAPASKPFPMMLVLAASAAILVLGIAAWFVMNRGH
jgi:hypothetical protein